MFFWSLALRRQSLGRAPAESAFEFWKEPPGKEHSELPTPMYCAFASGLGYLKQNSVLWACLYFLQPGMEGGLPLFLS